MSLLIIIFTLVGLPIVWLVLWYWWNRGAEMPPISRSDDRARLARNSPEFSNRIRVEGLGFQLGALNIHRPGATFPREGSGYPPNERRALLLVWHGEKFRHRSRVRVLIMADKSWRTCGYIKFRDVVRAGIFAPDISNGQAVLTKLQLYSAGGGNKALVGYIVPHSEAAKVTPEN